MDKELNGIGVLIKRCDILSPVARELITALNAELSSQYPEEGATHFRLDPEEVAEGNGAFLVVFCDGKPIGCGAVRRIEERSGELKRMYVCPEARGLGVGKALLEALETEARSLGLTRLLLETGTRQTGAMGLYRQAGFSNIAPYGEYINSPLSICLAKELS
jgi:GNAT superfamily N-acetyltransferase